MKEMVLQQKPLEKADFIVKITDPVGQFWQMESALSILKVLSAGLSAL